MTGLTRHHLHPALLRAIATKAIPGLSFATNIALLQQTAAGDADDDDDDESPKELEQSPLDYIFDNDAARNEIKWQLDGEQNPSSAGVLAPRLT